MNALNSLILKKLKPVSKLTKLTDGGGLHLLVTPAGKKTWRIDYRINGERRAKNLGIYPDMGLAEARVERDRLKGDLARGKDPEPKKRNVEAAISAGRATFRDMVSLYLTALEKKNPAVQTLQKNVWLLETLAAPLHDMPIADIRARDVLPVIEAVADSGRRESAVRLRSRIAAVFDFAIVRDEAEINPVTSLKKVLPKVEVESTAAITDEKAFGKLLVALETYGDRSVRHALKLQSLCYCRPVETRLARWSDVDLKERVWTIPKEVAKMRREHLVPLSRQAVEIFEAQREISGGGEIIFPNRYRRKHAMISENAMNYALDKVGYGKGTHTAHGFRSSASTILNERGWRYDVIEASLAHVDSNAVRRVYNRALYWKERVEMAQAWADLCDELRQRARRQVEVAAII
ncbi:tyrosine-type recombinase/integrase [Aurantimonas sp. VKM B-3413]|uniref:tyrosine-type recombinase/integrase n=1 Tax=Aurantimonas sp. VKM B-3413 TaxID=2779401 RepID=UPI001E3AD0DB|nr:tyrosine-type recombinase/integrase [Aurantimonas sp. VKM B-3413]MCB8839505.1 tyrosine-type recombinase/integrase [Aurantimonas sp. VKM B-3413]